jgi:hypothetical protein
VRVQVRPGRLLDLDFTSPESRRAYQASLRLIDRELKKMIDAERKKPGSVKGRSAKRAAPSLGVKRLAGQKRRRLALELI